MQPRSLGRGRLLGIVVAFLCVAAVAALIGGLVASASAGTHNCHPVWKCPPTTSTTTTTTTTTTVAPPGPLTPPVIS